MKGVITALLLLLGTLAHAGWPEDPRQAEAIIRGAAAQFDEIVVSDCRLRSYWRSRCLIRGKAEKRVAEYQAAPVRRIKRVRVDDCSAFAELIEIDGDAYQNLMVHACHGDLEIDFVFQNRIVWRLKHAHGDLEGPFSRTSKDAMLSYLEARGLPIRKSLDRINRR